MGIGSGMDNVSADDASAAIQSFWGAAPNSSIINLKVLDKNGQGSDSAVIAAIHRAIQLKYMYNIRVMNLSLGRPWRNPINKTCYARRWNKPGRPASSW